MPIKRSFTPTKIYAPKYETSQYVLGSAEKIEVRKPFNWLQTQAAYVRPVKLESSIASTKIHVPKYEPTIEFEYKKPELIT
jgi:hypothetical protein